MTLDRVHRQITSLFVDLVNAMELLADRDPEDALMHLTGARAA